MYKILMTYNNTEGMDALLNNKEFKVEIHNKPTPEQFKELIADYDGLMIRSEVKVTPDIIAAGKKLKFIGRAGTGVDNVDIPSATQQGIVVANVPGGNTISAAEHTVGLIMALARNIPQAHCLLKEKKWKRDIFTGTELYGKVLGLVGFGRIGREVAHRMQAFGMSVVVYDPFVSKELVESLGITLGTLDEVYAKADYISIHSPLNDSTRNLVNADALKKMKKGVRIINCARGGIVDEKALADAIKAGHVKGAAFDVFAKEPPVDFTLIETEGVVCTPHLAASTEEAQVKIAQELSEVVVDYFTKSLIRNAVNVPTLDWETYKQIEPYINLADKLGMFQSQILKGGVTAVAIEYAGSIAQYSTQPLMVAFVRGLLTPMLSTKVNFVNAMHIAKERGIKVIESKTEQAEEYSGLITATIKTDQGTVVVAGTIFGHTYPRIVRINDVTVDLSLTGNLLVVKNIDRPGIIGQIGTALGKNNINIAGMQVGRKDVGGEATTIINIDASVTADVLTQIASLSGVTDVKHVAL